MKQIPLALLLALSLFAKAQHLTEGNSFFLYHLQLTENYQNPKNWTKESEAVIARHTGFLDSLGKAGRLIFAGRTLFDPGDANLFGIALVYAANLSEAERILASDPAVKAGIQRAKVLPYSLGIRHFKNAPGIDPPRAYPSIQISADSLMIARYEAIDRDIWKPFSEAYAVADPEKYIDLHTPDFIRATGGGNAEVKSLAEYARGVRRTFNARKGSGFGVEIAFSFFERIAGEDMASERGIYRYTVIGKDGAKQHYYGKFHVFLRKIKDTWKIAVDYDSNEDGTVGEGDFRAGKQN